MDLTKFANKRARISKSEQGEPRSQSHRRPAHAQRVIPAAASTSKAGASKAEQQPTENWDASKRDWTKHLQNGAHGRMRLLFVGHNPSQKSWELTAPYAHPSNYFWKIMRVANFAPVEMCEASLFSEFPARFRIGFADLFVTMGSVASNVSAPRGQKWQTSEFCPRVADACGGLAPNVVALVSKAVAQKLLRGWKGDFGPVGTGEEWGLTGLESSEIWVVPSTSGRAVISWEDRLEPFQRLSEYVASEFSKTEADDGVNEGEGS